MGYTNSSIYDPFLSGQKPETNKDKLPPGRWGYFEDDESYERLESDNRNVQDTNPEKITPLFTIATEGSITFNQQIIQERLPDPEISIPIQIEEKINNDNADNNLLIDKKKTQTIIEPKDNIEDQHSVVQPEKISLDIKSYIPGLNDYAYILKIAFNKNYIKDTKDAILDLGKLILGSKDIKKDNVQTEKKKKEVHDLKLKQAYGEELRINQNNETIKNAKNEDQRVAGREITSSDLESIGVSRKSKVSHYHRVLVRIHDQELAEKQQEVILNPLEKTIAKGPKIVADLDSVSEGGTGRGSTNMRTAG